MSKFFFFIILTSSSLVCAEWTKEDIFKVRLQAREDDWRKNQEFLNPFKDMTGLRILDIGSGIGFHSNELSKNHTVTAIEPDKESIDFGIRKGLYNDKIKVLNTALQDVPHSFDRTFDNAISYLWLVPHDQKKDYFKRLHELLISDKSLFFLGMNKSGEFDNKDYVSNVKEAFSDYFDLENIIDEKGQSSVWFILRKK